MNPRVGESERWTPVPGNHWDLLPAPTAPHPDVPEVSVVVPYYRDQAGLDLLLAALTRQEMPGGRLQVVIADDGSPEPPRLPARPPFDLQVIRQPDLGFRASAARALGASVAEGQVLAFLDGDMIPDRHYLRHAVHRAARSPEAVVVGRRRHLDPARLAARWQPGDPVPEEAVLDEPAWLERAYASTGNLLEADSTAYRFMISAVLTVHRHIHDDAGGFDPDFVGYGGEDWEFAHRLWRAGALLAHEPRAEAWHRGPDFAGREDLQAGRTVKNRESLVLARKVSAPTARGWSWGSRTRPRVEVVLECSADGDVSLPGMVLCADAMVQSFPAARLLLPGPVPADAEVLLEDPRVCVRAAPAGASPNPDPVSTPDPGDAADLAAVPDWTITVLAPIRPARGAGPPDPAAAAEWLLEAERAGHDRIEVSGPAGLAVTAVSSRALWRARRWGHRDPSGVVGLDLADCGWEPAGEDTDLEAWWGGWG
ncbi:glycosyltransferase [Citricoccus sp. I39-566]|uniref:glycosyltransferase n=1 Tax=Citricoccus sp. I39-566 TaxID=3073268 RepID=UPI00286B1B07|nr:glycosyltransferase [Citricoccus sp. I39-566]WMY78773.1 glycosyltransferase [Citricoccus sp. I39-566]